MQAHRDGDGFAPLPHLRGGLFPCEHVEDADIGNQLLVRTLRCAHQLVRLDIDIDDKGEIAFHRLQIGQHQRGAGGGFLLGERHLGREHGEGHRRPLDPHRGQDARVQLTEHGERVLRPQTQHGGPSGVEPVGRVAQGHQAINRGTKLRQQCLHIRLRIIEVHGPPCAMRIARCGVPGQQARDGKHLVPRLPPVKGDARLEQSQIGIAPRLIARRSGQQAGQQIRAHVAHLGTDGVFKADVLTAPAKQRRVILLDKAVGDAFVVAEAGHLAPRGDQAGLHRRLHRLRHAGRQAGHRLAFEFGERGDAGDFLDQIGLTMHVRAP